MCGSCGRETTPERKRRRAANYFAGAPPSSSGWWCSAPRSCGARGRAAIDRSRISRQARRRPLDARGQDRSASRRDHRPHRRTPGRLHSGRQRMGQPEGAERQHRPASAAGQGVETGSAECWRAASPATSTASSSTSSALCRRSRPPASRRSGSRACTCSASTGATTRRAK